MFERLAREAEAKLPRGAAALIDLRDHRAIVGWRYDNEYVLEVLGRGAHQARTADVDLLDQRVERRVRIRGGLHEGIEIHDNQIDQDYPVRRCRREVVRTPAPGEDTAVHQGVQCLNAPVHHLGESRDLGDADDGQPCLLEDLRSATRGDQVEAPARQRGGELDQTGFVRNAQ